MQDMEQVTYLLTFSHNRRSVDSVNLYNLHSTEILLNDVFLKTSTIFSGRLLHQAPLRHRREMSLYENNSFLAHFPKMTIGSKNSFCKKKNSVFILNSDYWCPLTRAINKHMGNCFQIWSII